MFRRDRSANVESHIDVLSGKDKDAIAKAVEALVKIGAPAVEPLIAFLDMYVVWGKGKDASEALGRIGEPAVEPLIAALGAVKIPAQRAVVHLLAQIGDPRAVDPLIAALDADAP